MPREIIGQAERDSKNQKGYDIPSLDAGSFIMPPTTTTNANPKIVGDEVARLIYKSWKNSHLHHYKQTFEK